MERRPRTLLSVSDGSDRSALPISMTDAVLQGQQLPCSKPLPRRRSSARSHTSDTLRRSLRESGAAQSPLATAADNEEEEQFFDAQDTRSEQATEQAPAPHPAPARATRPHTHLVAANAERSARIAKLTTKDVQQSPNELMEDIGVIMHALHLFLNSRMVEANNIVEVHADKRIYYALAYALLATIKAFMTFEHQDLGTALEYCKDTLHIASLLRKQTSTISSIGSFLRGTGPSVSSIASMSLVQRHAELIYAECTLLKAILAIAHSGDIFGLLSEALHLRHAYGMYRSFARYVEWANNNPGQDNADEHFTSGVHIGNGTILIILGLMPSRVLRIMEIFGYEGDIDLGLKTLSIPGKWTSPNGPQPPEGQGIRRPLCDMSLLMYHLRVSTFIPAPRVDIDIAARVLEYNLELYPYGIYFLYFKGRFKSIQAYPEDAIEAFREARDIQEEYVQLKHICYWDISLCHMSLQDWYGAFNDFTVLADENNWSKAIYNYARAAALYQYGDNTQREEARAIMARVPKLRQKIAGKSIPLEKFVARKATKMIERGRLLLPGMEFAYLCHCYTYAPRFALYEKALPVVDRAIASFDNSTEEDDRCLAYFLRAVILRNMTFPDKYIQLRPKECPIPIPDAAKMAEESLRYVAMHAMNVTYDHYLLYFAHYELGRLYMSMGRKDEARTEFELVLSGKNLGDVRKGKYSMQNMAVLRSNSALSRL